MTSRVLLLPAVVLVVALSGCSGSPAPAPSLAPSPSPTADAITMAVCRDAGRIDMDYAEMASLGTRALASPVQAVAQAGQVLADAAGKTGDSTDTQARLDTERAAIALSKACDEAGYGG